MAIFLKKKGKNYFIVMNLPTIIIISMIIIMISPVGVIQSVTASIPAEIYNSDFESGSLSPCWDTDYAKIASGSGDWRVHSGTYGCHLSMYDTSYHPAYINQTFSIAIDINSTTSLTFYLRGSSSDNCRVTVAYSDGTSSTQDFSPDTTWNQYTVTLSVGEAMTSIKFERTTSSATTMGLDDIVLTKAEYKVVDLYDGDFEKGDLSFEWTTDYATASTTDWRVHSGTYGCHLSKYDTSYHPAYINQTFGGSIPVTDQTSLTFYLRTGASENCRVTITYSDGTNSTQDFTAANSLWNQYTVTLSVGKAMTSIKFERTTTSSDTMGLDDIELTKDEPTVLNGDFESGSLDPYWDTDYASTSTSDWRVHSGTYGCHLGKYESTYKPAYIIQTFSTPIHVESSTTLTFYLRLGTTDNCKVTVEYIDKTNTTQNFSSSNTNWNQYTVTLTEEKYMISIKFERTTSSSLTMGLDDIVFDSGTVGEFQSGMITMGIVILAIGMVIINRRKK